VGFPRHSYTSCSLCDKLLVLEMAKSDERGKPRARENVKCSTFFPDPTNILDYPDTM
jgi:hypothetical protein